MNKIACLLLISFCVLANASQVPAEWKARYQAEKKIIESKDLASYKAMVSSDYVWVLPDGKALTKKKALEEMGQMFTAKKIIMNEVLKSVVKRGDVYQVTFEAKVKMDFAKPGTLYFHEIGVDTWKNIGGKWVITMTVDKVAEQTNHP